MQVKNVLIFPCGTEIAQEVHAALKHEKSVHLYGASSVEDHGRMVFSRYTGGLPFVDAPDFDEQFEALIQQKQIDFIIPAHDTALLYLAENKDKFSATIIAPSASVCAVCRSKKATYDALAGQKFVPHYYRKPGDVMAFPVFLKPDVGQGSQGIMLARDESQLTEALRHTPGLIICEYLPGKEYTVDCYSNKNGELLFTGARERIRTKAGISVNSKTLIADSSVEASIRAVAETISKELNMTGPWFFQVKGAVDGTLKLLEIAPRIAGTMALHRILGVNFSLLALFEAQGLPISVQNEQFEAEIERALINRYKISLSYDCLYLDLDDTLVVHNKLNMTILQLVYQCIEKSIPVKLITRHYRDPKLTLQDFKLHEALFDEIIWITDASQPKSAFISGDTSLFIDDSYRERLDVRRNVGIAVLPPESAEALIDWRR